MFLKLLKTYSVKKRWCQNSKKSFVPMDQEKEPMKHKNAPRAIPESDPEIKELLERAKKMHKKLQEQIAELEAYGDKIPDVYRFFLKELNPNRIGNRLFREKYEKQKELLIQKLKTALGTGKIDELLQKEGMQKTSSGLRRHRLHGRQGWIRIE